jgi:hydrogenase maturation factor
MTRKAAIATTAGVAAAMCATVIAAAPAQAQGGTAVIASGGCTSHGTWQLKAKHDDGRIEIEFGVDVNRVGKTWHVRITDNGQLVTNRNATTIAPSGSFTVRTHTANRAGADVIRAHATRGDVTCGGSVQV